MIKFFKKVYIKIYNIIQIIYLILHYYENWIKQKTICRIKGHIVEPLSKHQTFGADEDKEVCTRCFFHFSRKERISNQRNKIINKML